MNRTKRKIFEAAMELFAQKGYDGTSVEEITSVVGIAKGTLYYHFSSKEEIFYFLVEEGMNLLKNSIEIKTSKCDATIDKLKAISLIQLKTVKKYESLLMIVLSQALGSDSRNIFCKNKVIEYINVIQSIIEEGQKNGQLKDVDSEIMASEIFSLTYSSLIYLRKINNDSIDVEKIYHEYEKTFFTKLDELREE